MKRVFKNLYYLIIKYFDQLWFKGSYILTAYAERILRLILNRLFFDSELLYSHDHD